MKPLSTFLIVTLILCAGLSHASTSTQPDLLLQQLSAVNAQWSKQPEAEAISKHTILYHTTTYTDWIAAHLMLVEQTLRGRDISHLSIAQQNNRALLLNKLNGYWHSRAFPVNVFTNYKTPVFIDATGNHCAVGYLMQQSGAEDLAQRINKEQRFAYVHDIKVPGVKDWADANGFTIDELAWIQPGYPPGTIVYDMDSGVNNTVNTISVDESSNVIYVGGGFTETSGGATCNHVAAWISGFAGYDWVPVGNGVNGTVHTLLVQNNKLYTGGEFTMAGSVTANHVAVYDIYTGQWQSMGSLDSTVRALAFYNGSLYAGGDFTGNVARWTGTQWQVVPLLITGSVRTLEVWNNLLVIGGDFDIATGAPRKHVIAHNGTNEVMMGFGTPTPVNDFTVHQGQLFAACDFVVGTDTCALAVYDGSNWEVRLKPFMLMMDDFNGNSIRQIISNGDELLAAGDFTCVAGMSYGAHLMSYSRTTYPPDTTLYNLCVPVVSADYPVHGIMLLNSILYFGGEFTKTFGNVSPTPLNHIGYTQMSFAGIENPTGSEARVFPNPVSDMLRITSADGEVFKRIEIFNVAGQVVLENTPGLAEPVISTAQLPAGAYVVKAYGKNGFHTARFVKN